MSRNKALNVPLGTENGETLPLPAAHFELSSSGDQAPTLRPTMEEFADFTEFVKRARAAYANYGLVKVIPPAEWKARKSGCYDEVDDMIIPLPIKQILQGTRGIYQQYNVEQKPVTVSDFRQKAAKVAEESKTVKMSSDERDRAYWRTVAFNPVLYGADMPGSLFDKDQETWNLAKLPNLLDLLPTKLAGVNDPYIYFGMWKAAFAWHVEDMDLYSINYLHFGEPKAWYSVPQRDMQKFEQAAATLFPDENRECKQFLRHKQSVISPNVLRRTFHVPIHTTIQEAGQFVITWPGAYHAGFNQGYNCAEAVNFALEDWISWGQRSKPCMCDSQRALINMQYFVYQFEMHKYGRSITNPDLDISIFNRPYDPKYAPLASVAAAVNSKASKKAHTHNTSQKSKQSSSSPSHGTNASGQMNSASASNAASASPSPPANASSPKKKITFKFVTVYETAPRPQLIRAPQPGARISPRFHPAGGANAAPASTSNLPKPTENRTQTNTKKRHLDLELDEDLATRKLAKLAEGLLPRPSGPSSPSVSAM